MKTCRTTTAMQLPLRAATACTPLLGVPSTAALAHDTAVSDGFVLAHAIDSDHGADRRSLEVGSHP